MASPPAAAMGLIVQREEGYVGKKVVLLVSRSNVTEDLLVRALRSRQSTVESRGKDRLRPG